MDLKEKTTEKLQSELKMLQGGIWFFIGILLVLLVMSIRNFINNEEYSWIIFTVASSLTLPYSFKKIKEIKNELDSRK